MKKSTLIKRTKKNKICLLKNHRICDLKWTTEILEKEALKHRSKGEFRDNNRKAYSAAYKRGILDKICENMKY